MEAGTDKSKRLRKSQFFLVRIWKEDGPGEQGEWCGRVQHVTSGEAHSFCTWSSLLSILLAMLSPEGASLTDSLSERSPPDRAEREKP